MMRVEFSPGAKAMRVVQKEIRKRGFFGWVFLILFLAFNAFMAVFLFNYWQAVSQISTPTSAAHTGAVIGGTIGTGVIAFFWVAGAVVLGLLAMLTRGRKTIIIEETTY
jgi:hypothetical protein